jgi:hypothetical protein
VPRSPGRNERARTSFAVPTERRFRYSSVEEVREVPKSLSASIIVDLHPTAAVGLVALLQGKGDVTKFTPAARIEEV